MCEQVRHAAGAAIFDVVMDRMGIAARGLECREHRRGLGPARDHEALAEHEILEPALLAHHAMLGGVEVGHVGSCGWDVGWIPVAQPSSRDNWSNSTGSDCPAAV